MPMSATTYSPKPLFIYPALPKYEIRFYIAVVFICVIYAWSSVFIASNSYVYRFYRHSDSVKTFPIIGPRYQDISNWEWTRWSPFAQSLLLPYYVAHSLIFQVSSQFLTPLIASYISLTYSAICCCYMFTPWLVFLSVMQGTLIFTITTYAKHQIAVWLSALPLLYYIMNWTNTLSEDPFLVLLFVAYTLLSYISFNLEVLRGEIRQENKTTTERYLRMLFYAFYPPYLISLIVTYPEFERQISEREKRTREWKTILFFGARLLFWWMLANYLLYFSYHEAILFDTTFAQSLPKDQLVSLGMALGQFFHLKYVIIFGLPALFAQIDKMQPPNGPICIARVTLYSKIWRCFDRGLYAFFKRYIFLPICQPTFSIGRKFLGVLVSYSFVLLWHGFYYHNIVWIILNIAELFVEYGGKGFYAIERVRKAREKHISDVAFRRILAWLQIVPFVFGLYSNFYFLGGEKVGYIFVNRIWNEETLTLQFPFFLLISLGYCYTHVTMEIERYLNLKEKVHSA